MSNLVAVRMPKMSMTMTEGEVTTWHLTPGAVVAAGDVVCDVMTDKVEMEVESPVSGVLERIEVEVGQTVAVGSPIAWITSEETDPLADLFEPATTQTSGDAQPAEPAAEDAPLPDVEPVGGASRPAPAQAPPTGVPTAVPVPDTSMPPRATGPRAAVPVARRLATELGVDLATVPASGPDGLVLPADVTAMAAALLGRAASIPPGTAPATPGSTATEPATPAVTPLRTADARRRDQVRRLTAERMTMSTAVPQFTLWRQLVLETMAPVRGQISWTSVLLRAYARALRTTGALLGSWVEDHVEMSEQVSIAMAVDTPAGLIAPVFADPDLVSLEELDREVRAVTAAARGGKVDSAHLMPARATLSNLGGLGVDRFEALLTPPQASALSLGSITRRPIAVTGGLGVALTLEVGLTVDHRVADGADGARLLQLLADLLDDPASLLAPARTR